MRRREPAKKPAAPTRVCAHPRVSMIPGEPASRRLCDPRLLLWEGDFTPSVAKAAEKARRDHWPNEKADVIQGGA